MDKEATEETTADLVEYATRTLGGATVATELARRLFRPHRWGQSARKMKKALTADELAKYPTEFRNRVETVKAEKLVTNNVLKANQDVINADIHDLFTTYGIQDVFVQASRDV